MFNGELPDQVFSNHDLEISLSKHLRAGITIQTAIDIVLTLSELTFADIEQTDGENVEYGLLRELIFRARTIRNEARNLVMEKKA